MLKTLGPHSSQGPDPAHKSSPWGWVARRAAKTSSNQLSVRDGGGGVYSRSVQLTDKETYQSNYATLSLKNRSSCPGLIIERCFLKQLSIPSELFAGIKKN